MPRRGDDAALRFAEACRRGDLAALRSTLDDDAVAVGDGMRPLRGAEDVAVLAGVLLCGRPGTELTVESVNGGAGLALRRSGRALAVVSLSVAAARIVIVWFVLDPAKLGGWHLTKPWPPATPGSRSW